MSTNIPPIPHYPYWRYLCPKCRSNWEIDAKFDDYFKLCPDCASQKAEPITEEGMDELREKLIQSWCGD